MEKITLHGGNRINKVINTTKYNSILTGGNSGKFL